MFRCNRDQLLTRVLYLAAACSSLILVLITAFLVAESLPALTTIGLSRFFTDTDWHPGPNGQQAKFNLLPALAGTLATSGLAMLAVAPLGLLSAVFSQFFAPRMIRNWYRRLVELMAGIPSVVFGLWGLVTLVPIVARFAPPGASLFTGGLVLGLMIFPTMALLCEAALAAVPKTDLSAAAALGLSPRNIVMRVAVPSARGGICTAAILSLTRALGETMAVLMVCGNVVQYPGSVFDSVRTVTATIALEMGYAQQMHRAALFVCGLVLLALVVALVAMADFLGGRRSHER